MLIALLCLVQLLTGALLETPYDRDALRYFAVAVFYPVIYWMMMAVVTTLATPAGLFGNLERGRLTRWRTERDPFEMETGKGPPDPAASPLFAIRNG